MSAYVDLTEFMAHPQRTGIQRVCGELCRYWPLSPELKPVKVLPNGKLVRLPSATITSIADYFRCDTSPASVGLARIRELNTQSDTECREVSLSGQDVLLCPELFYDPFRVGFYRGLPAGIRARCCFLVYDLLPMTHAQYFDADIPHDIIGHYFCLLREVGQLAFISKATRAVFYERFLRQPPAGAAVLHLGSDGLGERSVADDRRIGRSFVVLGTIEPRKNHKMILDAFESVLQDVEKVELIFVGQIGWADVAVRERIKQFRERYSGFSLITDANDRTVYTLLSNARASIFISAAEGFGLPPVESLWVGTPVICGRDMPSLEGIESLGTHIVEPLNAITLREAVLALMNDEYRRDKALEARKVSLSTWEMFAAEVAGWIRKVELT